MDVHDLIREVGALTEDDRLVRGALAIGGGTLAVIGVVWRTIRSFRQPRQSKDRVKIDVPDSVRVTVDPVRKDD